MLTSDFTHFSLFMSDVMLILIMIIIGKVLVILTGATTVVLV